MVSGEVAMVEDLKAGEPKEAEKSPPLRRMLSVEETGVYLGLSAQTIYNGIAPKSKKPFPVKPRRIGKCVRFDIKDLDRYIDSLGT